MRRVPAALALAVSALLAGCGGGPPGGPGAGARIGPSWASIAPVPCLSQSDDRLFLTCLQTEVDEVWSAQFRKTGRTYTPPALRVGRSPSPTGGQARDLSRDRAYFSGRSGIHFPDGYLDDVRGAHGARAHTVLTFTLGHETGHHVQLLLHPRFDAPDVDVETQADCYAGFWAHREADTARLDVAAFRSAAEAELRRLSRDAQEVDTHGNADQRIASLDKGLKAADPSACDVGGLTWR